MWLIRVREPIHRGEKETGLSLWLLTPCLHLHHHVLSPPDP
jgi:hypothetical protein